MPESVTVADTKPETLRTPTDLPKAKVSKICDAVNGLVADAFILYMKTKNFHWHVSGPHFRDYHVLLDEPLKHLGTYKVQVKVAAHLVAEVTVVVEPKG